jgi:hypothetical protein
MINFLIMFQHLAQHDHIIVTGPHRAGTTFASEIIAEDLGYRLLPENSFGGKYPSHPFRSLFDKLAGCQRAKVKAVYHCPGLAPYIHLLDCFLPAIVFMKRSVEDIVASERRIKWEGQEKRLIKSYYRDEGVLAAVTYETWEKYQKPLITHPYDLEYESLNAHPRWVPKEQRANFTNHQTRVK